MRALFLLLSLAAFAPAQENNIVLPSAEGFTVYQTVVTFHRDQDPKTFEQEQLVAGRIKREYSRHPDGREVLAQVIPALISDPGHPMHVRQIWERNGVMTAVRLPMKHTRTVVEPGNERLSGHAKPGSSTCEPTRDGATYAAVYVGNESLQGLGTYRWRTEGKSSSTNTSVDRWYWKEADCLEVQVETLNKDNSGALTGRYFVRFDRLAQNADLELFFIPADFVEESSMVAEKRYLEKTLGKDYLKSLPECYRNGAARPDNYEANHAEALRRRGLATSGDKQ